MKKIFSGVAKVSELDFNMYKNIVNNYFRTETFEKAKEFCARDMMQLNNRYITEAVCRGETLNRIDALEKEKKNSISKDKIREKKQWYIEAIKYDCNGNEEVYKEVIEVLEELLGDSNE